MLRAIDPCLISPTGLARVEAEIIGALPGSGRIASPGEQGLAANDGPRLDACNQASRRAPRQGLRAPSRAGEVSSPGVLGDVEDRFAGAAQGSRTSASGDRKIGIRADFPPSDDLKDVTDLCVSGYCPTPQGVKGSD